MAAGYETEIVLGFLKAYGEVREDGQLASINEIRTPEPTREKLRRWETWEIVSLDRVDSLLMQHDLMLYELDDWARETYGRDGFVGPPADPVELRI